MDESSQGRIVLADDHVIFRRGIKSLLELKHYDVVAETGDGYAAIEAVTRFAPDIAVLDFSMPLLNGIEASREIIKGGSPAQIILLTMFREEDFVLEALSAGVRGYVLKCQASTDLFNAIEEVSRGSVYLSPGVSHTVVNAYMTARRRPPEPLTDRERQVLQLIAEGFANKQIARQINVSVKTVETHRTRIMRKLEIHNVAGLVRYAYKRGMITL